MKNLLEYNAFGLIKVSRNEITATITAVIDNRAIHRTFSHETDLEVMTDKTATTVFAAWIDGDKSRLTMYDVEVDPELPSPGDLPEVGKVVAGAINMIKAAIN